MAQFVYDNPKPKTMDSSFNMIRITPSTTSLIPRNSIIPVSFCRELFVAGDLFRPYRLRGGF